MGFQILGRHMGFEELADLLQAAIHPDLPQRIDIDGKSFQVGMNSGAF